MHLKNLATFLLLATQQVLGLEPPVGVQNNTFNSTYVLSDEVARDLELDADLAEAVETTVRFEQSNWAGGSVFDGDFYTVPPNASALTPGSLIKVEQTTNISLYTIPPSLSLSRFVYQSENVNGSRVPVSAYVLWPFSPRQFPNVTGIPIVAYGHGTSGYSAEGAPSHIRNLWQQEHAPFPAALAGYAVIGTDYAGLGISRDWNGNLIPHQYGAAPACANDLLYSVQAAQAAWPGTFSNKFVLLGHSQGASCVWNAAQRLANQPIEGYLGGIAAAPLTDLSAFTSQIPSASLPSLLAGLGQAIHSIFPSFNISDFLTPLGIRFTNFLQTNIQGVASSRTTLFSHPNLLNPSWNTSPHLPAFYSISSSGRKPFAGPLLVLQGEADEVINPNLTAKTVNETCQACPDSQLYFQTFPGTQHNPLMYASRLLWMEWIADRFREVPLDDGEGGGRCERIVNEAVRPISGYQDAVRFYLQWEQFPYQTY